MPRFNNSRDLERYLKKALDRLQAETLIKVQKDLGDPSVSPRDTGRFRSSWFAAEGSSSSAVAPEGTDRANEDAKGLTVSSDKTYHLTNNLVYAAAIALGENTPASWGGQNRVKAPISPTWFTDFKNARIPELQQEAANKIKRDFDL